MATPLALRIAGLVINNGLLHTDPLASTVCFHCLLPRLTLVCLCYTARGPSRGPAEAGGRLAGSKTQGKKRETCRVEHPKLPEQRLTQENSEFGRGCGALVPSVSPK